MIGNLVLTSAFRLYRAAQYTKVVKRPSALWVLSQFPKLDCSVFQAGSDGAKVLIKGSDIDPTLSRHQFLLRGSDLVRRLVTEANASFKSLPDGVLLDTGEVKLKLQTWEELFIAAEVFAGGIYNLKLGLPFVLIDVGMNVGTTALFFARLPDCQAVYGFEPFPKTVEKARANLALNPAYAPKVQLTPRGLAARSFSTELDYFEEYKGSVGMNGLPNYITTRPESLHKERAQVSFLACSEVIRDIVEKHKQVKIVCKLDCEGAEYEIIESLEKTRVLPRVDYLMIEWHRRGAAALEQSLARQGFSLVSFSPNTPSHNMLYAWNVHSGHSAAPGVPALC
jgi:FkbM family methyltransferase